MKKVLSVLLAAAMVMGMSVSAMADYSWTAKGDNHNVGIVDETVKFEDKIYVVRDGKLVIIENDGVEIELKPGDDIYFKLLGKNSGTVYTGEIDADWSINIKGNKYVEDADFVEFEKDDVWNGSEAGQYVKVELVDDLDEVSDKEVSFRLYLADAADKNAKVGDMIVKAEFANLGINDVSFVRTNDADEAAVWKVAKNTKGTATFDFDDAVYFTVKMVSEEKVTLNLSTAYDKAIDKAYNEYDADLNFFNFKGSNDAFTKTGELFIATEDLYDGEGEDCFIYEVVDGELVEVEATWTDEYTITDVTEEYEGWVIETNELGYYVVADEELVVAEAETEVEAPVEADKANPETGAADFVGAAVAMAVVSVAAAGALALKK